MLLQTRPGQIDIAEWTSPSCSLSSQSSRNLLMYALHQLETYGASYALITDEMTSVALFLDRRDKILRVRRDVITTLRLPTRAAIATMIYVVAREKGQLDLRLRDHPDLLAGTMPSDDLLDAMLQPTAHCSMDDFDMYTMLRDHRLFSAFEDWKWRAQEQANANPLETGTILHALQDLSHTVHLVTSPFRIRPLAAGDRALLTTFPRESWEKCIISHGTGMDAVLFRFRISKTLRVTSEPDAHHYSQVVAGQLIDERGEAYSPLLCLKLYDERRFAVPNCRDEWVTGRDLIKREKSVYDRLKDYQGTLLPHEYGFYEVRGLNRRARIS